MIILLETLHPDAEALLADYAPTQHADADAIGSTVDAGTVNAILTRGKGRIDRALIERCANLRVVARCGVGLDNLDTVAAAEHGVPVIYAPGSTTVAVAEHALLLMLALARRVQMLANAVDVGDWAVRNSYSGMELAGKTLGIVGLGDIGRRTAELGEALGMSVITSSRRSTSDCFTALPLDELLQRADVISLHTALTDETRGLIGARELALMRPHALLINTARGGLIDQAALRQALIGNKIGGFAADVLDPEPPAADDPLLGRDNVLLTPHVAALTDSTYREICVRTARNVLAVLRGGEPEVASIWQK